MRISSRCYISFVIALAWTHAYAASGVIELEIPGMNPATAAADDVCVGYTHVTNAAFAQFAPSHPFPLGCEGHPVVNVSYEDAVAYCEWLTENSPGHAYKYRLPTQEEWELAAGHMPKDADFNCGVDDAITTVDAFATTKGACGGVDFWGNCWEWTSTKRGTDVHGVKGGAFDSKRTECRTEARSESRKAAKGYPTVTFRVVREDR